MSSGNRPPGVALVTSVWDLCSSLEKAFDDEAWALGLGGGDDALFEEPFDVLASVRGGGVGGAAPSQSLRPFHEFGETEVVEAVCGGDVATDLTDNRAKSS